MGNFSWIIIVIVIIQAIAGAVAKASEKRKAQMKLSDTPKTDSKKIEIPRPVKAASERRANQKNDLERLRAARIEALRSRSTPKQASVAKSPVPSAPKTPDIPAVAVPRAAEKKVTQSSSTRAKRAERDRLREIAHSKRSSKTPRDHSDDIRKKTRAAEVDASSKAKSASASVNPRIKKPTSGAVPTQPLGISSDAMRAMLSDPESFKKAFILSELIAPPVSMRPPSDSGTS